MFFPIFHSHRRNNLQNLDFPGMFQDVPIWCSHDFPIFQGSSVPLRTPIGTIQLIHGMLWWSFLGHQRVSLWSLPKGSRCWLALWGTPWIGSPDITSMNHGYHGKSQILVNKFTNCQLSIFEKHLLCLRLEIVPNLSGPHEHSNTGWWCRFRGFVDSHRCGEPHIQWNPWKSLRRLFKHQLSYGCLSCFFLDWPHFFVGTEEYYIYNICCELITNYICLIKIKS